MAKQQFVTVICGVNDMGIAWAFVAKNEKALKRIKEQICEQARLDYSNLTEVKDNDLLENFYDYTEGTLDIIEGVELEK